MMNMNIFLKIVFFEILKTRIIFSKKITYF